MKELWSLVDKEFDVSIKVHLPAFQVVTHARDFLRAANLVEREARRGDTDLYFVAAMNSGLAAEQYLKSFLVESDPDHPSYLQLGPGLPGNKHDLSALYEKIPQPLRQELDRVSDEVDPEFPLGERIKECSKLFTHTRYGYEAGALEILHSRVFELAPHLDMVLERMTAVRTVNS